MVQTKRGTLKFHSDWFSEHESSYDQILAPRLAKIPQKARALVIGTVEGRSVEWLLNHVNAYPEIVVLESPLTRKDKVPRCVATRGVGVRVSESEVRSTLNANLKKLRARRPDANIRLMVKPITEGLLEIASSTPYDAILIDSMSSKHALECAVFAFTVLKPGGVMVFTNYTHGKTHDASCARRGIDGFLDAYVNEIQTLRIAFHLFLERRSVPFPMPLECHAEVSDPDPIDVKKFCK